MKTKSVLFGVGICMLMLGYLSYLVSKPSFNGTTPGCSCHTFQSGILSAAPLPNLAAQITLTGVNAGARVAGELVDSTGTVVAVIDQTTSNPFTLTAPRAGTFTVNAGYAQPQRRWDSVRVSLAPTGVGNSDNQKPEAEFKLDQNYPNPFNPSSKIEFSIPHAAFVNLRIYNVAGEEVATLVSQPMAAGRHSVSLVGGSLPSGVYFYRLQTGQSTQTRKLVLLK